MKRLLLFALLLLTSFAQAEDRPQLTWEGYVTGGALLFIEDKNVDVQGRQTGAVDRAVFQFTSRLPKTAGTIVEMKIRKGSGKVEIAEQPSSSNDFSAVIYIATPKGRQEKYVLDFFWPGKAPAKK